jgi:hypothetical protein
MVSWAARCRHKDNIWNCCGSLLLFSVHIRFLAGRGNLDRYRRGRRVHSGRDRTRGFWRLTLEGLGSGSGHQFLASIAVQIQGRSFSGSSALQQLNGPIRVGGFGARDVDQGTAPVKLVF